MFDNHYDPLQASALKGIIWLWMMSGMKSIYHVISNNYIIFDVKLFITWLPLKGSELCMIIYHDFLWNGFSICYYSITYSCWIDFSLSKHMTLIQINKYRLEFFKVIRIAYEMHKSGTIIELPIIG